MEKWKTQLCIKYTIPSFQENLCIFILFYLSNLFTLIHIHEHSCNTSLKFSNTDQYFIHWPRWRRVIIKLGQHWLIYQLVVGQPLLFYIKSVFVTLQWRHNGRDGVSNHQPHDCLPNRLFRCRSKKISRLCVTGLYAGNSASLMGDDGSGSGFMDFGYLWIGHG